VPTLSCPNCGTMTPRRLAHSSDGANVNYYKCASCGHVWTVDKRNPDVVRHVTPLEDAHRRTRHKAR